MTVYVPKITPSARVYWNIYIEKLRYVLTKCSRSLRNLIRLRVFYACTLGSCEPTTQRL